MNSRFGTHLESLWPKHADSGRSPVAAGEAHRAPLKFAGTAARATRCEPGRLAVPQSFPPDSWAPDTRKPRTQT